MPKPTTSKIINGTLGNDTLFGDTSGTLSTTGGKQTINGLAGDDALYGDAVLNLQANGGNDTLNGGDGNDVMYGDASSMSGTRPRRERHPHWWGRQRHALRRCLRDAPELRWR